MGRRQKSRKSPYGVELLQVKPIDLNEQPKLEEFIKETEEEVRWESKIQYLLTTVGFAVGLGNIWRFPYLCQTYGGGAFLIPYLLALVFEGLPLLYLEMAIGQRFRKGSIGVWKEISPFLGGVGIGSMIISFCVSLFYNSVLVWVLWYLINSFRSPLPWSKCPEDNITAINKECVQSTPVNYFWYRETLNISTDIEKSGYPQWWLVLCLALAWFMVFICFIKGLKSIGKAVYVTTTLPYAILTIFMIRALTLPGAIDGLVYLFTPDWAMLRNPQVWLDASTQIFFSLSVAFGGLIAFSSFNSEHNNCERDAILVGLINSATSIYAAIPIFAILGFKAQNNLETCQKGNVLMLVEKFNVLNESETMTYDQLIGHLNATNPLELSEMSLKQCDLSTYLAQSASGTGLAFITFTQAVLEMPIPQLWAVLFFLMLFSLGLSSMFGTIEGVLNPICELQLVPKGLRNEIWTGLVCLGAFFLSLIFTLASGNYWVEVFNTYIGSIPFLIVALFEVIGVVYVHGIKNFSDDIYLMIGKKPNWYWKMCWVVISPLMLLVIMVQYVVIEAGETPTFHTWNPDYELFPQTEAKPYPPWVFAIGIVLCILPVIFIPLVALYHCIKKYRCPETNPYNFSVENVGL
ncbi:sodium-dependent neutral amino acid transporter B(0)AT3-like [Corythoichthys intestinalis]|uniref:sodium-dependent neutral amino acid transporter B(0)AT3-like n=1 Tax=Corythoichthys intestinalis TaxID=161448 RepID=UPI0025A517B7|nr:sodium-dependent neutral amino acid transporter B(0)AT3-like [Corythoichthys intestinalis]XP_061808462.1 sodium-dependent neutral amino acid transporter B(0)AT3-like [Nerophis lumbriciformis]